jgi:serine phosphatase RsbU (regulator of sigma subunit)
VSRLRLHALPAAALLAVVVADLALGRGRSVYSLVVISPLVAGTLVRRRATAVYAVLALLATALLGVYDLAYTGDALAAQVLRLVGVAAGGVLALVAATLRQHRDRLLSAASAQAAQARDAVALVDRLQRSLLTDPPPVPGLELAVRYLPAVRAAQVGGDWYDAFGLPDGTTMLVIGDVAGHDVAAAATMAEARGVLRGIAQTLGGSPASVLGALDGALDRLGDRTLITAVAATLGPTGEGTVLRWSNAGHPPPLLLAADGTVQLLERTPDPLLGVEALELRTDHDLLLRPGDTLLLYTDGLVERRGVPLDRGIAWLAGELPPFTGRPLDELCDALLARTAAGREDDVAVLAARVTG